MNDTKQPHRFTRQQHPLGWGDAELAFLKGQGLTMINLYRAMGYRGKVVPQSFKERVKAIASKHENTQEPSHE